MPAAAQDTIDLRSKCGHFRVLVIGRANAGKTTLLRKVCDSTEDPEIYGTNNEKIDPKLLEGSAGRGIHDIELQLIFKSNPRFIFHDSRGFESGSTNETEKVKDFIAKRAATGQLSEQLHAIWYCLPTDTKRPLLQADDEFFGANLPEKVPVIAVFTKFDGLMDEAFTMLLDEGCSPEDAEKNLPEKVQELLKTNFKARLQGAKRPPSDYVQLEDMREKKGSCKELIEKTADALTDDTLRLLLVSVQQNNIDLCIRYAVKYSIDKVDITRITRYTLSFFPHAWRNEKYDNERGLGLGLGGGLRRLGLGGRGLGFSDNLSACTILLEATYPKIDGRVNNITGRAKLISAICICLEQTFTQAAAMNQDFATAFSKALHAYHGSDLRTKVDGEINALPSRVFHKNNPSLTRIITANRLRINHDT